MPPGGRPRMFNSRAAQIVWTIVPIVTLGLAAAVPFVTAAVKGVIRPWIAILYVAVSVAFLVMVTVQPDEDAFSGLLLILLIVAAATHTALLDSARAITGKRPRRRATPDPERPRANPTHIAVLEHDLLGIPPEPGSMAALTIALRKTADCIEHRPVDTTAVDDPHPTALCEGCGRHMVQDSEGHWQIALQQ
ncbi:hypothetical protein SMALB_3782 [Streptomyces malaysiensis]|uniref:Uncharacterized protein n=2 Tax=Streptomyces malaysiensis TaxID=92644 RepID=A0A7X5X353_STRMQ|nr:hypothetical protein [Streptomyces malaysiensis]